MRDSAYYQQVIAQSPVVRAFLRFISWAEGASYNTLVGGGTFTDTSTHPGNRGFINPRYNSSAAGAYQFIKGTWNSLAARLGLSNFTPRNQDIAAVALLDQRGGLEPLLAEGAAGFDSALRAAGREWAGVPNSSLAAEYGQRSKSYSEGVQKFGEFLAEQGGNALGGLTSWNWIPDPLGVRDWTSYLFEEVPSSVDRFGAYYKRGLGVTPQNRFYIALALMVLLLLFVFSGR